MRYHYIFSKQLYSNTIGKGCINKFTIQCVLRLEFADGDKLLHPNTIVFVCIVSLWNTNEQFIVSRDDPFNIIL